MSSRDGSQAVGIQGDDGSFQRKTFEDIERDVLARAREELGESVDLSQGSPIKQLLDVTIYEHERTWKVLEDLYYSSYYEDAYETQLDKLLSLATMDRVPRRGATGAVSFSVNVANTSDVTIPRGTVVTTAPTEDTPAIPFKTTAVAILEAGSASVDNVPIRAGEPWEDGIEIGAEWLGSETNVAAHTITEFRTGLDEIDHVTNPAPTGATDVSAGYDFIEGRDRESDAEFRDRYEQTLGENGAASLTNIRANVEALAGVETAHIEENVSMDDNTDTGGLPPKSFRVTALATKDTYHDTIAEAIGEESRAAGIEAYGSESGQWVSDDGVTRTEGFDLATETLVYVQAVVTHDSTFPDDGNKRVQNAIIEYIGGETTSGTQYDGVPMTEDVIYDLVWKAAMSVQGVWKADVWIGTSDPPETTETIEIGDYEVANTSPGAISISTAEQDRP
jgi:hypothetical protein